MERRLSLDKKLRALAGSNVYYQPPESIKMNYPAIVYHLNDAQITHADDLNYIRRKRYTVTYISRNPDDNFVDKMMDTFTYCSFDRWYAADNLNHFVYDLYY